MNDPFILLAENDYDTELRVRRAFEQNNLIRYLSVVRDGALALKILSGLGGAPFPTGPEFGNRAGSEFLPPRPVGNEWGTSRDVPRVRQPDILFGSAPPQPPPPSIPQEERETSPSGPPAHRQISTAAAPVGEANPLPCLLLLDLELPGISGLEILRRLRSNPMTKELPVVILTSSNEERDVRRSYHLGVNCYLRKPLEFAALVDSIRQLGLYWLDLDDRFGAEMQSAPK